jgi:hypothetical protein
MERVAGNPENNMFVQYAREELGEFEVMIRDLLKRL